MYLHVYGHHVISFWRVSVTDRADIVRRLCGHRAVSTAVHRNRRAPVRLLYGGRSEIVRWLCNPRVFLGIRVSNVYNYSF